MVLPLSTDCVVEDATDEVPLPAMLSWEGITVVAELGLTVDITSVRPAVASEFVDERDPSESMGLEVAVERVVANDTDDDMLEFG